MKISTMSLSYQDWSNLPLISSKLPMSDKSPKTMDLLPTYSNHQIPTTHLFFSWIARSLRRIARSLRFITVCQQKHLTRPNSQRTGSMISRLTQFAHASSGGFAQYWAYSLHVGKVGRIGKSNIVKCKFGVGFATSIGTAKVMFLIAVVLLSFKMYIVDADVPSLLHLQTWTSFDSSSTTWTIDSWTKSR